MLSGQAHKESRSRDRSSQSHELLIVRTQWLDWPNFGALLPFSGARKMKTVTSPRTRPLPKDNGIREDKVYIYTKKDVIVYQVGFQGSLAGSRRTAARCNRAEATAVYSLP